MLRPVFTTTYAAHTTRTTVYLALISSEDYRARATQRVCMHSPVARSIVTTDRSPNPVMQQQSLLTALSLPASCVSESEGGDRLGVQTSRMQVTFVTERVRVSGNVATRVS